MGTGMDLWIVILEGLTVLPVNTGVSVRGFLLGALLWTMFR